MTRRVTVTELRRAALLVAIFTVDRRPGGWKRLKADVFVSPTQMLQRRSLTAA
jgi:hypothetical protein